MNEKLAEKGFVLPNTFAVGSARASLNPPLGISLAGHGMKNAIESRHSTENWDELMEALRGEEGTSVTLEVLTYFLGEWTIAE